MTDSKIPEIQANFTEVDELLRARLAPLGLHVGHILLAVTPDSAGIVRSNVDQGALGVGEATV